MGCSNHHPHCQIWACSFLPNEPRIKDKKQRKYLEKYGRPMLMDYVNRELKAKVNFSFYFDNFNCTFYIMYNYCIN